MNQSNLKPEVDLAVKGILQHYPEAEVTPDGEGGVIVSFAENMGALYTQQGETTLNFAIPHSYPQAQVKDFYVIPQLVKHDGSKPAGNGFHADHGFKGQNATLVSRHIPNYQPERDKDLVSRLPKILRHIRTGGQ